MATILFKFCFLASLLLFSLCLGTRSVHADRGLGKPPKCLHDPDCRSSCPAGWYYSCDTDVGTCNCKRDAPLGKPPKCKDDPDCRSYCPTGWYYYCDTDVGTCACMGDAAKNKADGVQEVTPQCSKDSDCQCPQPISCFCDDGWCSR